MTKVVLRNLSPSLLIQQEEGRERGKNGSQMGQCEKKIFGRAQGAEADNE
jgi:hypothetical protein